MKRLIRSAVGRDLGRDPRTDPRGLLAIALCGIVAAVGCAVAPVPSGIGGLGAGGAGGGSVGCPTPSPGGGGSDGAAAGADPSVRALPWLHVEGNQIEDPAGNPVILRGVAFADLGEVSLQEDGVAKMMDRVTNPADGQSCSPSWETRVVRLAVSPPDGGVITPIQYRPGGTYYDNVLRPAVDNARQRGLYVIIDWHYIDDTSLHRQTTTDFWTDIAPRFANDTNVLFELYNEPINNGSWTNLRPDMQAWTDIVRAAAPNNLILIGTPSWCQIVGTAAANPISGANLVYVAHMYPQHWAQPSLRNQIASAAALVPVMITEWGFQQGGNAIINGTITSYGNPFMQFVEQQRVSWTGWCASRSWQPAMFKTNFALQVGESFMGGFVKDWLFQDRGLDQPAP
jgi:endoglucanase